MIAVDSSTSVIALSPILTSTWLLNAGEVENPCSRASTIDSRTRLRMEYTCVDAADFREMRIVRRVLERYRSTFVRRRVFYMAAAALHQAC